MTTEEKKESIWVALNEVAKVARRLPDWAKAGINLSARNYVTYRGLPNDD